MASPKADHLPFIPAGLIWDGVTEYRDVRPPGVLVIFLLRMYGDGTRRFSEHRGENQPLTSLIRATADGWEQIGITFQDPGRFFDIGFLGYDGVLTFEPPNQYFAIKNFRAHAARFAHQLQSSMGHHDLASKSEEDRITIHQTLSRMIGAAARRYQKWYEVSPTEVVDGGTLDEELLWKRQQADYEEVHRKLCGRCEGDYFPVEMALDADLPAFERVNGHGEIYAPNRTAVPWQPELMELATSPYDEFYDELKTHFDLMVRHYLRDIGKLDRSGHAEHA